MSQTNEQVGEMSQDDLFLAAINSQKNLEKEKEESKKTSNFTASYEQVEWMGLEDGVEKVFGIFGAPINLDSMVRRNPYDPLFLMRSNIAKDDKSGTIGVNWKFIRDSGNFVPDPDWILTKLYNTVMAAKWTKNADGTLEANGKDGKYVKLNENTESYKRVFGNATKNDKFPKPFYPSKRVLLNVIDRMDDWCVTNKKYKVLSSAVRPWKTKDKENKEVVVNFADVGIPFSLYSQIVKHAVDTRLYWDKCDRVVTKNSVMKSYTVFDATDTKYITSEKAKAVAKATGITKEEFGYGLVNLEKVARVTSYYTLQKHLIGLFHLVDAELGTNFTDELKELVKVESEAWNKANAEKSGEESIETSGQVFDATKLDFVSIFPKWNDLTFDEKSKMMDAIEGMISVTQPKYKKESTPELCVEETCHFVGSTVRTDFPVDVSTCPVCGTKQEIEDVVKG